MIVMDSNYRKLEAARRAYRRQYNRGYRLSEQGHDVRAQAILDRANAAWSAAQAAYPLTRIEARA